MQKPILLLFFLLTLFITGITQGQSTGEWQDGVIERLTKIIENQEQIIIKNQEQIIGTMSGGDVIVSSTDTEGDYFIVLLLSIQCGIFLSYVFIRGMCLR